MMVRQRPGAGQEKTKARGKTKASDKGRPVIREGQDQVRNRSRPGTRKDQAGTRLGPGPGTRKGRNLGPLKAGKQARAWTVKGEEWSKARSRSFAEEPLMGSSYQGHGGDMAGNYLSKVYRPEDYIRIAQEAERWIRSNERTTPYGKRWVQSPDSDEDFSDYPMLTEKALYGGSAGIGLFYLRLYQATGRREADYLGNARAAADNIIATDEGPGFYTKTLAGAKTTEDKLIHVKNMPGWTIGFYNGPIGGAYLALKLYEETGEERYSAYALKAADDLLSTARTAPEGIYWSEQNDVCGDLGFVLHLISCWKLSGDGKYLASAVSLGDYVLSKGRDCPHGGKYWKVVDLTLIDFPEDVIWVNFAHGTAGVGWIFALLYKYTHKERFLEAAKDAASYIESLAVGDGDAVLIPYLDSFERGPSTEFYYLSTCHGPVGTSFLFEELYRVTGENRYLDFVKRLSRGIIAAGAPEHYSRGYWKSQSLCCGAPGLLENFVAVYRLTGEKEFLTYAIRTARVIIGESFVEDSKSDIYRMESGSRRWYGNWWRTIPNEVHSYTGLYIGTAGNAWSLLTLAGALRGEDYADVVERNYREPLTP